MDRGGVGNHSPKQMTSNLHFGLQTPADKNYNCIDIPGMRQMDHEKYSKALESYVKHAALSELTRNQTEALIS